MEREIALKVFQDFAKYKDKETGISIKITAEDAEPNNDFVTVNLDFIKNNEKVGHSVFQINVINDSLDLSIVTFDEDVTHQGFGTRSLNYLTDLAKEAKVKYIFAQGLDSEASEGILNKFGWQNNVSGLDSIHAKGKKLN